GQDLNLRPPGYEPPRSCIRIPPYSAEKRARSRFSPTTIAFRRKTVTSPRKSCACRTLAADGVRLRVNPRRAGWPRAAPIHAIIGTKLPPDGGNGAVAR